MVRGLPCDASMEDCSSQEHTVPKDQLPGSSPSYLARFATLPDRVNFASAGGLLPPVPVDYSKERIRHHQIEHTLTVLASVVDRLAKEAQHSRPQVRASNYDRILPEEHRAQRELLGSFRSRLVEVEERVDRDRGSQNLEGSTETRSAAVSASLSSIRDSLAAVASRRSRIDQLSRDSK